MIRLTSMDWTRRNLLHHMSMTAFVMAASCEPARPPRGEMADVRSFGAKGDGRTDDSKAVQAAVDSAKHVHFPEGIYRFDAPVMLHSNSHLMGAGPASRIVWSDAPYALIAEGGGEYAFFDFLHDISVENLAFEHATSPDASNRIFGIYAANVRGFAVRRNVFISAGGLLLAHQVLKRGINSRDNDSITVDPAVAAGFSATDTNDLNEDVEFIGNTVIGDRYYMQGLRLNFVKRGVVSDNILKYANISWWGGGAKRMAGGDPRHLRRVRDIRIFNNYASFANGGIYGNNGDNIVITNNTCENIVDTGIDLEGCSNCLVENNTVRDCGNFCYSIFYASINNVFRHNIGIQTGAARGLNRRLGTTDYGANPGDILFAWRTGGFSDLETGVDAVVEDNTFEWRGPEGRGRISPGPMTSLTFRNNTLLNVRANLVGRATGPVIIEGNRLTFDKQVSGEAEPLLAAGKRSGAPLRIQGNKLDIRAKQPPGTVGLQVNLSKSTEAHVLGNEIVNSSTSPLSADIELQAAGLGNTLECAENVVSGRIVSTSEARKLTVRASGNRLANGRKAALVIHTGTLHAR